MQAKPVRLRTDSADFEAAFRDRLHWSADTDAAIEQRVADILADVLTPSPCARVKSLGDSIQPPQPQSPDEFFPKRPMLAQQRAITKKRRSLKDQSAAHALLALFAR